MSRLNCLILIKCIVFSMILTGCNNRPANQRNARKQVTQTVDEKTNEQLRNITGRKKQAEAPENTSPDQEDSSTGSPLDRAARNLEQKEMVPEIGRQKPTISDEVMKSLEPLIHEDWQRFGDDYLVWFDPKEKQVIVGGQISLRAGPLEMFACPAGTNEHESVIATLSDARSIHACLLAVGAIPGMPAYWTEETGVVTAIGPTCEIDVIWSEPAGAEEGAEDETKSISAKELVLDAQTGEALQHDWVFCGSKIWQDPKDPDYVEYQADSGFMICVSNFPSAMLDVNVESSTSDSGRLFVANPDKTPRLGQPVLIIIKPDVSTNPDQDVVAELTKKRDEALERMNAEMELRMKKREEEWARRDAEDKAKREAAAKKKKSSKSNSNSVEKNSGENEKSTKKEDDDSGI